MIMNSIKCNLIVIIAFFAASTLSAKTVDLQFMRKIPLSENKKDFSGSYFGINTGYFWGRSNMLTTTTFVPNTYFFASGVAQINSNGSLTLNPDGFIGGLQAGFNRQMGGLVFGAEMDFSSLHTTSMHDTTVIYQSASPYAFTLHNEINTDWIFSARPRIGWAANKVMTYVTAGLAVTNLKSENTFSDNYLLPPSSNAFESSAELVTKLGWLMGFGFELALSNNCSLKAEYLYANFRRVSSTGELSINPAYLVADELPPSTTSLFNHSVNLGINIARLGINYKFSN